MRPKTIVAVILIALGIAAFVYQGITYTARENIVDVGPLNVTIVETRSIPLPPIVGAIALAGGIAMLLMARKRLSPAA